MKKTKTFLPSNYELPASESNYFKFEKGKNKFRILSSAVVGFEYWNDKKEVFRQEEYFKKTPGIKKGDKQKHFWSFLVWNYKQEKIQIMHLTQTSLQKAIMNLMEDEDWGEPINYDITITKKGEGKNTEYQLTPKDSELSKEIQKLYKKLDVDLELLLENKDPFNPEGDEEEDDEVEEDNPFDDEDDE